jgi:hypothetical protein
MSAREDSPLVKLDAMVVSYICVFVLSWYISCRLLFGDLAEDGSTAWIERNVYENSNVKH